MPLIPRPDDDIFHNRRSYQECGEALSAYLLQAGDSLSVQETMEIKLQVACCEAVIGHVNEAVQFLAELHRKFEHTSVDDGGEETKQTRGG